MLTNPLRDRFGIVARLEFYTRRGAAADRRRAPRGCSRCEIAAEGALEIARRSRGTPRIANRLLRRVRDFAEVRRERRVTREVADAALRMLDVDAIGLDLMDRKLLLAVIEKFGGGPVGVDNLAAAIGEERDTIEDVLEPFLIQQGYLQRTPRGRIATLARLPALRPRAPPSRRRVGRAVRPMSNPDRGARALKAAARRLGRLDFVSPVRVYYENTDAGGVVYHADVPQVPGARAHRVAAPPRLRSRGARAHGTRSSSW